MMVRSSVLFGLFACLCAEPNLQAQPANEEDVPKPRGKTAWDSFPRGYDTFGERSVYHQRRVRGMKQDLNDFSSRLQDLRNRFDAIFHGRAPSAGGSSPFEIGSEPQFPEIRQKRYEYQPPSPRPPREPPPSLIETGQPHSNEDPPPRSAPVRINADFKPTKSIDDILLFNVTGPGEIHSNTGLPIPEDRFEEKDGIRPRKDFDYYLFPRVSLSLPAKKHRPMAGTLRKYDPGFALAFSGGVRKEDLRYGVSAELRRNELSEDSTFGGTPASGSATTLSFFAESTYVRPLSDALSLIGKVGAGPVYSHKKVSQSGDSKTKTDWNLGFSLGGGLSYDLDERGALQFGYSYFYDKEVSAHNLDLGYEIGF